jgi:hypothetical protein
MGSPIKTGNSSTIFVLVLNASGNIPPGISVENVPNHRMLFFCRIIIFFRIQDFN